jgi:hypothetical protein
MEYKSKNTSLAGKIIFFTEICLIIFIFQQGFWRLINWLVSKNSASSSYDIPSCFMIDDNSLRVALAPKLGILTHCLIIDDNSSGLVIFAFWLGFRLALHIKFHKNNLLSFNFILSLLAFLSTVYYENCLKELNSDFNLASFEINSFKLPYLSLFFLALVIYRLLPESYRKRLTLVEEKIHRLLSELYRKRKIEPNQEKVSNDFPVEEDEYFNKAQKILAKDILVCMQNDLDRKGAIVYSLEGKWGTGKTSFLKLIKRKTTGTKLVCKEYKAWLQDSESNIRDDFFKFLAEIAQDQISTQTANKILNYANSLKQLDNKLVNFLMSLFDRKPDQVRYEEIEEDLRYYERPLLIVIDDLDRLNREEILEVLKIMRSSANFPYLAFLLLYDRSYINKIIENEKYLEKIVNCEFKLPSYSTEKMSLELVNNFTENFPSNSLRLDSIEVDDQKISSFIRVNHSIINQILRTIRDQKRFFKSLRLKYLLFFKTKSYGKENNTIIAWTLFLLELIQYESPEIFEKIKNKDPDYLISNSKDKFFNYVFQSGSSCIFRTDRKKDLIQVGNSSAPQPLGNGLPETTPDYIIECFKLLNKVKEIYHNFSQKTNKQNDYPMLISKSDCFRFFFEFGFNDEMFSSRDISEEIEKLVNLKHYEGHSASKDTYYAALHGLGMKILANSDRKLIKDSFNQIISSLTFQNLDQAKVLIDLFFYRYYQARLHSGTDASLIEDLLPIFYDSLKKLLIRVKGASEAEFKILKTYILKNFMPQDKLLEKLYFLLFKLRELCMDIHEDHIEDSLFKEEIEEAIKETDTVLNDSSQSQQLLKQYMELDREADFGFMFQLVDNIQATKKMSANYRRRAIKSLIEASVVQEYTLKSFMKSFLDINENAEDSGETTVSLKLMEVPYTYPPYYFSRFLLFMGMTTDFSRTRVEKFYLKQLISDGFRKDYTEELLGKYSYANQYLDEFLTIVNTIIDDSAQIDGHVDCKDEFESITRRTILN